MKYLLGLKMSFQENKRGNWKEPENANDWQSFLKGHPERTKGLITTHTFLISQSAMKIFANSLLFKQVGRNSPNSNYITLQMLLLWAMQSAKWPTCGGLYQS